MGGRASSALGALLAILAGTSLAGCLELSGFQTFRVDEAGEGSCADGDDGEGDGFVDCSDAECGKAWACAPVAPTGWTGPFSVEAFSDISLESGSCADAGEAVALLFEGAAIPACTACTCAEPTCPFEFECSASGGSCSGALTPVESSAGCHEQPELGACKWKLGGAHELSGLGRCGERFARALVAARMRVLAGRGVCFGAGLHGRSSDSRAACVLRTGEHECPQDYPDRRLTHADYSDARWCTPCVCELGVMAQCTNGSVTAYSGPSCTGADAMLNEQVCAPVAWTSYEVAPATLTAGSCLPPSGGLAKGQVVLGGATTVCCREAEGGA